MKIKFLTEEFAYDGSQLQALFAYRNFAIEGESIISWLGSSRVSDENMKDGADLFAGESSEGDRMLHFIIELFGQPMMTMVSLQRLFAAIVKDVLEELSGKQLRRDGDDLFWNDGKLSISIATRGAVSSMIHFAVNETNEGTPVKTACLGDLGVNAEALAEEVMKRWESEYFGITRATKKIFPL